MTKHKDSDQADTDNPSVEEGGDNYLSPEAVARVYGKAKKNWRYTFLLLLCAAAYGFVTGNFFPLKLSFVVSLPFTYIATISFLSHWKATSLAHVAARTILFYTCTSLILLSVLAVYNYMAGAHAQQAVVALMILPVLLVVFPLFYEIRTGKKLTGGRILQSISRLFSSDKSGR